MPSAQVGLLAHERAVGVEVVAWRCWRQNGWSQTSSACAKRWTCSETPSSLDPALGGGLAVALGVRGGEVALGRRCPCRRGAGARGSRSASLRQQRLRHAQVERRGDLQVLGAAPRPTRTRAAGGLDQRGVVGGAASDRVARPAPAAATSARNTCGVWTAHSAARSSVARTRPSPSASLTVSVTGAAAMAPSHPVAERVDAALDQLARSRSGRAASCTTPTVASGAAAERVAHRRRARGAAGHRGRAPRS